MSEEKLLEEFEAQMKERIRLLLEKVPIHIKVLGDILRKSVITGKLNALWRFCLKHAVDIRKGQLEDFRDFLIINRIDLKDLEPEARARLRKATLRFQDAAKMSGDYKVGLLRGDDLRCRDCKYFVRSPDDDPADPHSSQSCVALGTKGADAACYGFTLSN